MTKSTHDWVVQALSEQRLAYYLKLADGNKSLAIEHYKKNLAISADMYQWLAIAEIALRNSLISTIAPPFQLTAGFDPFLHLWQELRAEERADYELARQRASGKHESVDFGRIVAELNLGFWRYLLAADYEHSLWTHYFRHAFPGLKTPRRHEVYESVELMNRLRNRIAHHERVLNAQIQREIEATQSLIGWVSPEALAWAKVNLPDLATARI